MKTLTLNVCRDLTNQIQEIAKQYDYATAEDIETNGLCLGECTWKEGEFSLKTDCGWILDIYENKNARTLSEHVDAILYPYGYAVGDPYSDRELHVFKF
jgi:hypothetical protein